MIYNGRNCWPIGNKCWGTVTVEDKIAPVVVCNCVDMPVNTPITGFQGHSFDGFIFARPNGTTPGSCSAGVGPDYYDAYTFQVTTTGTYTFNAAGSNGDIYAIIYQAPFGPNNPCTNFIAANDDSAGGLGSMITVTSYCWRELCLCLYNFWDKHSHWQLQ